VSEASGREHPDETQTPRDGGGSSLPRERRSRWDREDRTAPAIAATVKRLGEGPPVVFLHGLLGLNSHWIETAERLQDQFECLLVEAPLLELRGRRCSMEGVQKIIERELASLTEPMVLVGNSLGGHIALRIALSQPDRVRGLVLAGSSGLFERTFERDVQHRPSHEWIRKKIAELFADPSRMPEDAVAHAYRELRKRGSARALVRLSRSAKADHMGGRLGAISAPTLLLWGRQDIVTPPHVAEEFAALVPDSRIEWIDDCGHAPMLERPEALAEGIRRFLCEIEESGASSNGARQEVA
jgi:pimeloyl-ACP methyl ester carboxylesterase